MFTDGYEQFCEDLIDNANRQSSKVSLPTPACECDQLGHAQSVLTETA